MYPDYFLYGPVTEYSGLLVHTDFAFFFFPSP